MHLMATVTLSHRGRLNSQRAATAYSTRTPAIGSSTGAHCRWLRSLRAVLLRVPTGLEARLRQVLEKLAQVLVLQEVQEKPLVLRSQRERLRTLVQDRVQQPEVVQAKQAMQAARKRS